MSQQASSIQPPPPASGITFRVQDDSYLISGHSKGIPLELFSPDELEAAKKALQIKEKVTGPSTEKNIDDLFAQQEFDWTIEISTGQVTLSTNAPKDDVYFHRRDVKKIDRSAEGYYFAEVLSLGENEPTRQILTGRLEAGGEAWLLNTLTQLFELDQKGVSKSHRPEQSNLAPPETFRVTEQAGGSRTRIDYRLGARDRLMPLVIGGIVLSLAAFSLHSGGAFGEGVLPDLLRAATDDPLWSKVLQYAIIAGFAFLAFKIARMVLGTFSLIVRPQSLEVRHGILGIAKPVSIARSQMKDLEQFKWTHILDREESISHHVQYWRLVLHGDQTVTLLDEETNSKNIDWLARYLSEKYDLPVKKSTLPNR